MILIITEQTDVPTLKESQADVGGYVETLCIPGRGILLFNEDGKAKNLAENPTASHLAGVPIVGKVIWLASPLHLNWGCE